MQKLKYGRKPPKNAPAIEFAKIRRAGSAAIIPPTSIDYLEALNGIWQMLGNDQYGDCVAVTWANVRLLMSHYAGGNKYPTQDQVFTFYKTQNPGFPSEDNGMDIQTALEDLVKSGGPDGVKAVAFAKVDYTSKAEVQAAIDTFGFVWVGINVLDINQDEFGENKPWNYVASSPVDGGHSVVAGGYGPAGTGALAGDVRFETWAQETSFTDSFWQHQVEECWVVIWPENMGTDSFQSNIDSDALAAEYSLVTDGKVLEFPPGPTPQPTPVPTPAPVPVTPPPVPVPGPDSDSQALWDVAGPWVAKARYRSDLKALKAALETFGYAKGLL